MLVPIKEEQIEKKSQMLLAKIRDFLKMPRGNGDESL